MKQYEALGLVEVQYFAIAMEMLDEMLKTADIEYLVSEKYLGGRLVTLIIGGTISNVEEAIAVAQRIGEAKANQPLKMALVIPKPHEEIMKFILPYSPEGESQEKLEEKISSQRVKKTAKNNKNNKKIRI